MKKMFPIALALVALFCVPVLADSKHEFDKATYEKLAKKTVGRIVSGNVDAGQMLADAKRLVELGVAGCREHLGEEDTVTVPYGVRYKNGGKTGNQDEQEPSVHISV